MKIFSLKCFSILILISLAASSIKFSLEKRQNLNKTLVVDPHSEHFDMFQLMSKEVFILPVQIGTPPKKSISFPAQGKMTFS
jgi:hypothetical protein